jgi:DNA-binding MarR family transcriptional regulator
MAGCACGTKQGLTEEQKKILEAFKSLNKPVGTKDIAEATGLDKKLVSSTITKLKKDNLLDSPVRCKYGITGDGVNALKC